MEWNLAKKKVDRLTAYVTGQNIVKQLGISKLLNGRRDSQANAVVHLIKE